MRQNILVTGAAGFIGSHTVDQLLATGHTVWGVDNFRTGKRENLSGAFSNTAFSFEELDVAEDQALSDFVERIRPAAIIHLAALVSVPESIRNPALNQRLNFDATRVIADACRRYQVQRVVFASSAAVYGNPVETPTTENAAKTPLSPYGEAKLASEDLLLAEARQHGYVARCNRYFNVYGPRQDPKSPYSGVISIFMDHLSRGTAPTIFGDGKQTRDFISVHDVARANVIAATAESLPSGVVNICTGASVTINDVWYILCRAEGTLYSPNYAPAREGDIRHSCGSSQQARREIDFVARVPISEGLTALSKRSPASPANTSVL